MNSTDPPAPLALLVEDDHHIQILFGRALKAVGYEVRIAGDGQQALDLLAEVTPTLIVLDLGLPYVSGVEVYRKARSNPRLAQVWIVLATANTVQASYVDELASGDDYIFSLIKPITLDQLKTLAAKLVDAPVPRKTNTLPRLA